MREEKENELKYNIETDKQNNFEVNETQSVYLTKDKKLMEKLAIEEEMERRFGCNDIQKMLDEAEGYMKSDNAIYLTHEEVFSSLWRKINKIQEEKVLDEADEDAIKNKKRYTHEEIFEDARRIISEN